MAFARLPPLVFTLLVVLKLKTLLQNELFLDLLQPIALLFH